MRLVRFRDARQQVQYGQWVDDREVQVLQGTPWTGLTPTGQRAQPGQLLAPIAPVNIFCVGLNYREHAREGNQPIPSDPVIFMKPTTAVTDPGAPIRIPQCSSPQGEVDYEVELAVVIGTAARDVAPENALRHVLGYTVANDVSARRWQRHNGGQWIRGKSFDTFCPLGPVLVTADEIPDPQQLRLRTLLNGQCMQDHTTADMIFSVAQIISFLSRDTTLLPGTLILTGTPQGVGFARTPPVWLRAGDTISVEIEKIGVLTNPVV